MGPAIIARNYAETLLALARRQGGGAAVNKYAAALDEVAELLRREPRVREFLETPRVGEVEKKRVVREAFSGRVPEPFLRFLLVLVDKRRQALLGQIADEYRALVDDMENRVRAEITVAAAPTPELEREIVGTLERKLGHTVIATFRVDPSLLGGVMIRVGDQILDGSVRRRLASLRRRLLEVRMPGTPAVNSTLG
jgi:F-type H+-transporting ATPase subunit delta